MMNPLGALIRRALCAAARIWRNSLNLACKVRCHARSWWRRTSQAVQRSIDPLRPALRIVREFVGKWILLTVPAVVFLPVSYIAFDSFPIGVGLVSGLTFAILMSDVRSSFLEHFVALYFSLIAASLIFTFVAISHEAPIDLSYALLTTGFGGTWYVGYRPKWRRIESGRQERLACRQMRTLLWPFIQQFLLAQFIGLLFWLSFVTWEVFRAGPDWWNELWQSPVEDWLRFAVVTGTYLGMCLIGWTQGRLFGGLVSELRSSSTRPFVWVRLFRELDGGPPAVRNLMGRAALRLAIFLGFLLIATASGASVLVWASEVWKDTGACSVFAFGVRDFSAAVYAAFMMVSTVGIVVDPGNCGALKWIFVAESTVGICLVVFGVGLLLQSLTNTYPDADGSSCRSGFPGRLAQESADRSRDTPGTAT